MSCEAVRHDIPLYHYGELSPQDEERLEEHVNACPDCAAELERRRVFFSALDAREQEPPAELLAECRRDLMRSIRQQAVPVRKRGPWALIRESLGAFGATLPRWRQPLGALALVALGFFSARFLQTNPRNGQAGVSPELLMSNVRSVQQDPSGVVRIAFDETRRRVVSGPLEDSRVQQLLMAAMRQDTNPGVRVETMSVLKDNPTPSGLREVLVYALKNDPNPGVRLKAIESLRSFATEEAVRRALAQALIGDDNPGVRIQAIDLLVQQKDDSMVGVLQDLVNRENNQYIRMRMVKALEEMNASVGTF
jgi:hypothetical protein